MAITCVTHSFSLSLPPLPGTLSLSYTKILGDVPFELGDCKELAYLHVGNNRLIGVVPLELGQLQKLQKLGHLQDFGQLVVHLQHQFHRMQPRGAWQLLNAQSIQK